MNLLRTTVLVGFLGSAVAHAEALLDPILITAKRTEAPASKSLASVTVIDRRQIEQSQSQTVYDLLQAQAGIDVTRDGGPGQRVAVFMRGTNSNHTLILVDGVRVSSSTTGAFAWQFLPVAQIERIEIVRGPRAALYGSDAIGGVIQIFTRKKDGVSARAEYGSNSTYAAEAGFGKDLGLVEAFFNTEYRDTDGFSAQNKRGFSFNPDDDGATIRSISGGLNAPAGSGELSLRGWLSRSDVDFDQGDTDSTNAAISVQLDQEVRRNWEHSLRVGYTIDDSEISDASPFSNDASIDSSRVTVSWQNDIAVNEVTQLTAGIDWYREEGRNTNDDTGADVFDDSVHNSGVFAEASAILAGTDIVIGLRGDDHSEFGWQTTGSLALGRQLGERLKVRASAGTAFRAPNFNELFHPGFGGFFSGNPDLDPEESASIEVGAAVSLGTAHQIDVSVFYTRIKDLIAFEGGPTRSAININKAKIHGVELEWRKHWRMWSITAAATWQRPRDKSIGEDLLRRPREKLAVSISRRLGNGGQVSMETLARSDHRDFDNTTFARKDVGGYTVVNLSAEYPLTRAWALQGRVENLFDKNYQVAEGFNTPDLSAFIAIRFSPGTQ